MSRDHLNTACRNHSTSNCILLQSGEELSGGVSAATEIGLSDLRGAVLEKKLGALDCVRRRSEFWESIFQELQ
jgi:hypothetical protein